MTPASDPMAGGCLCGQVRFAAMPASDDMSVCHCGMCRRWTGGVFMGVDCGDSVVLEGAPKLGIYRSSDYGERVFCPECGTSLFWRMKDGSKTEVAMSALDDPSRFGLKTEVFIDAKPPGYAFANKTRQLTQADFLAMIAGGANG